MAAATEEVTQLDVGNILLMEHLNVTVPNQLEATLFYIVGLGLTRDPFGAVSIDNMHVNVGSHQFHLPTREAQVVAGHIGLVIPSLDALERRLTTVQPRLAHTKLHWERTADHVQITCPWGNQIRAYEPSPRFGEMRLGIPYIEFLVKPGAADGIARFYEQVFATPARASDDGEGPAAHVRMGTEQRIVFREHAGELRAYDGYHIAVYVANFSSPYRFFRERGLLTEEIRNHQFRFQAIVDPASGLLLHELEHEVRDMHHPQYRRVLINREA
ncbi:MAG TPA: hypothetical protein VFC51_16450 [Chloroflexota bacterium]|nr:hypothetical protein [Chloroflexota bacterium]